MDLNTVVGIAALVLAVLTTWLSLTFYLKGKEAERNATKVLAEIQTQVSVLTSITGRTFDKLLDGAFGPSPELSVVADLVRQLSRVENQPAPAAPVDALPTQTPEGQPENYQHQPSEQTANEAMLLSLLFYAGLSNGLCGFLARYSNPKSRYHFSVLANDSHRIFYAYLRSAQEEGLINENIDGDDRPLAKVVRIFRKRVKRGMDWIQDEPIEPGVKFSFASDDQDDK